MAVQCRSDGRINAAGKAEHNSFYFDSGKKMAQAVCEGWEDIFCFHFFGGRYFRHFFQRFQRDGKKRFLVRFSRSANQATPVVYRTVAIEGVYCFAIVLYADVIYIKDWRMNRGGLSTKDTVALFIFSQRIRRGGEIDDEIQPVFRS